MTARHPSTLDASHAVLLVVDVQERFRSAIGEFDAMVAGCLRLVKTFQTLGIPILATEQYPRGLGRTVPELGEHLSQTAPDEKTAFSSFACRSVAERLAKLGAKQAVVCGIETHVCVNQTVHDLLAAGYQVHVAVDAVASRKAVDRETALRKMERAGALLTTSEMAAFELLEDSKHEKFKEVQAIFK